MNWRGINVQIMYIHWIAQRQSWYYNSRNNVVFENRLRIFSKINIFDFISFFFIAEKKIPEPSNQIPLPIDTKHKQVGLFLFMKCHFVKSNNISLFRLCLFIIIPLLHESTCYFYYSLDSNNNFFINWGIMSASEKNKQRKLIIQFLYNRLFWLIASRWKTPDGKKKNNRLKY